MREPDRACRFAVAPGVDNQDLSKGLEVCAARVCHRSLRIMLKLRSEFYGWNDSYLFWLLQQPIVLEQNRAVWSSSDAVLIIFDG